MMQFLARANKAPLASLASRGLTAAVQPIAAAPSRRPAAPAPHLTAAMAALRLQSARGMSSRATRDDFESNRDDDDVRRAEEEDNALDAEVFDESDPTRDLDENDLIDEEVEEDEDDDIESGAADEFDMDVDSAELNAADIEADEGDVDPELAAEEFLAKYEKIEKQKQGKESDLSDRKDRKDGSSRPRKGKRGDEKKEADWLDKDEDEMPKPRLRAHPKRRRAHYEDFPGMLVSVHSVQDPAVTDANIRAAWDADPFGDYFYAAEAKEPGYADRKRAEQRARQNPRDGPVLKPGDYPTSYHDEFDREQGWYVDGHEEKEEDFVEVLHVFDTLTQRMQAFRVGVDAPPPTNWPPKNDRDINSEHSDVKGFRMRIKYPEQRTWLTWGRTWDDMRKNGANPSADEIQKYLTDVLGMPKKSGLPKLPTWDHQPFEEFEPTDTALLAPDTRPIQQPLTAEEVKELEEIGDTDTLENTTTAAEIAALAPFEGIVTSQPRYHLIDTQPWQVLKTEAEWRNYVRLSQSPRTFFDEARRQYRKKLHLTRVKYLTEYRRVKALHDANIQARWDQSRQIKAENDAHKAARRIIILRRSEHRYDTFAARRARIRAKSRFTRQNKEMKQRRHAIHMFNYMLKEREYHWIQPSIVETTAPNGATQKTTVHSANLTTALFEKQERVVGFWPRPIEADIGERREEQARRRLIKEQA